VKYSGNGISMDAVNISKLKSGLIYGLFTLLVHLVDDQLTHGCVSGFMRVYRASFSERSELESLALFLVSVIDKHVSESRNSSQSKLSNQTASEGVTSQSDDGSTESALAYNGNAELLALCTSTLQHKLIRPVLDSKLTLKPLSSER